MFWKRVKVSNCKNYQKLGSEQWRCKLVAWANINNARDGGCCHLFNQMKKALHQVSVVGTWHSAADMNHQRIAHKRDPWIANPNAWVEDC